MRDFFGQELVIGDMVAFRTGKSRMQAGWIESFTKQMVKLNVYIDRDDHYKIIIYPHNCVKFVKPPEHGDY